MGKRWKEYSVGEYRLRQLGGQACAVWYEEGKRHRYRLGVCEEAEGRRALEQFVRDKSKIVASSLVTISELFAAYTADRKFEGKDRHDGIKWRYHVLQDTFGYLRPEDIDKVLCKRYANEIRAGKAPWTIYGELNCLRNCLSWARKEGHIEKAPYVWMPPRPDPKNYHITHEEAERLIAAAASHHVKLFIILALATAARKEALLELTWDRVDFERGTIKLALTAEQMRHKKQRATVPINSMAMAALTEARAGALTEWVIEYDGRPVKSVRTGFERAATRAGLPECTPHVLRHSAAVWMAEAGHSMAEIAQYLGHKDSRVTERVYARFSPGYLKTAANALDLHLVRKAV